MNYKKSKLIVGTFDGIMKKLNIIPKSKDSKVEFQISYYNDDDVFREATVIFEGVIAVDFEVNYFDCYSGEELFGFYEIYDVSTKKDMIEKIFSNRLEGYLYHGDYIIDYSNPDDMLNAREAAIEIFQQLDNYHLYQQQTRGGIFYILANNYRLIDK